MDKLQTLWNSSIHGSFYRRIEPHVFQKIKFTHQNRSKETTITRLRLGKYPTNEYLAQINVVKSNRCTNCGVSVETVEHYLLRCPNSELCKQIIHSCCSLERTLDIESVYTTMNRIIDTLCFVLMCVHVHKLCSYMDRFM